MVESSSSTSSGSAGGGSAEKPTITPDSTSIPNEEISSIMSSSALQAQGGSSSSQVQQQKDQEQPMEQQQEEQEQQDIHPQQQQDTTSNDININNNNNNNNSLSSPSPLLAEGAHDNLADPPPSPPPPPPQQQQSEPTDNATAEPAAPPPNDQSSGDHNSTTRRSNSPTRTTSNSSSSTTTTTAITPTSNNNINNISWPVWCFVILLGMDFMGSIVLLLPIFPSIYHSEDEPDRTSFWMKYRIDQSLMDVSLLAFIRIILAILALLACYIEGEIRPEFYPLELYHPTSRLKKTRDELEEELLEQPCCSWWYPHISRPAFSCEVMCVITTLFCIVKCLLRMNVEIGGTHHPPTDHNSTTITDDDDTSPTMDGVEPIHPVLWLAIAMGALFAVLESTFLGATCDILSQWGKDRQLRMLQDNAQQRGQQQQTSSSTTTTTPPPRPHEGDAGAASTTNYPTTTATAGDRTTTSTTSMFNLARPIRLLRQFASTLSHDTSSSLSVALLSQSSIDEELDADDSFYNNRTLDNTLLDDDGNNNNNNNNHQNNDLEGAGAPTTIDSSNIGTIDTNSEREPDPDHVFGVSDIGSETDYQASWKDLISVCAPDVHLIGLAFVFLLLAAAAQVYIPRFTGKILDSLTEAFNHEKHPNDDDDDDDQRYEPMDDVPGFLPNVQKLIVVSIFGGVFSGLRGSIFTVVGGRVNVRLRMRLMDSLLVQDIGFFDTTKTGDLTSRLSSDTTLVGDQVTLNVNVFLRSLVQAIGVLIFMFVVSWQLSILAFISVPAVTILSKWYGAFIRRLTKVMQKKLADGNSVSEAAISSMPTVRAFDAAKTELNEFESCMQKYLDLNVKSAIAYSGYSACVTSLPQLVTALVVFYGGLMVRNESITSGELVSFLLYLQSLSDAFSNIGYIFSSLTQAVGAADKVFELMYRKPRFKEATTTSSSQQEHEQGQQEGASGESTSGTTPELEALLPPQSREQQSIATNLPIGGMTAVSETSRRRGMGLEPEVCLGEIEFQNVDMYYPARPQRKILNQMSLRVPAGKVAALVGQSGGGKSSVISLLQHLYEPSAGKVLLDGIEIHELSPRWLSRNISIVSQEPTLFGRSLKRNIMYGLEGTDIEPSDEEIERVAKLANADAFIQKMPQKYETDVGERGVQLSGGQKQRIAIARALVRKPKVLLLDEATSALDAESEHMVQEAIDHMLASGRGKDGDPGMTVLVVAHRLSTVRNADIIFVVKDGQVVEQGNHADLIQNPKGAYSVLIQRQMEVHKKLDKQQHPLPLATAVVGHHHPHPTTTTSSASDNE